MKKLSKRLLAVMLSVMLVIGALPFMPITAMADAESDLVDAIAYFEDNYVVPLSEDGYDALYTNMGRTYTDYLAAIEAHKLGTASQMEAATVALTRHWTGVDANNTTYAYKMESFTEPEANGEVKIGDGAAKYYDDNDNLQTGESQPVAGTDYRKIIYSDGLNNNGWLSSNRTEVYGEYGLWTYQNYYDFYYPNTVVLVDGKGEGEEKYPLIPIVLGITSNGSNSSTIPEFAYEATEGVDLTDKWVGTLEGHHETSSSLVYTKPTWPNMAVKDGGGLQYINIQNGKVDNPFTDANSSTKNGSFWQIYKNHLKYTFVDNVTDGSTTISETYWLGAAGFRWLNLASGTRSFTPLHANGTKIHAVNYILLKNELEEFMAAHYTDFSVEKAQDGAFSTYFAALDSATSINPTDLTAYPYANAAYTYGDYTGMEAAVKKCGDDIEAAVLNLQVATMDDTKSQVRALDTLINEYKEKMYAGKVYTKMTDAYDAYLKAVQYRDAIEYGQADPDTMNPTLKDVLIDLNTKTAAMLEIGNNSYNYIAPEAFDGDSSSEEKSAAYNATYNGLVYASMGATRDRGENSADTGDGTVLRMNNDYSTTYLYLPKAVAVYDGGTKGSDSDPFTVPALLGFNSHGGSILVDDWRWLISYKSTTSALPFLYNWKTRTFVDGDQGTYVNQSGDWQKYCFDVETMIGTGKNTNMDQLFNYVNNAVAGIDGYTLPTKTYIENASLNQLLNTNSIADAKDAVSNGFVEGTTYETVYFDSTHNHWKIIAESNDTNPQRSGGFYSNARNDHGGNTDDPENFYANVLKITNPYTTSSTAATYEDYYYKYSSIGAEQYAFNESTFDNSYYIKKHSSGWFGTVSTNNYYNSVSGTLNTIGLYVINYYPVQKMIDDNSGLLTDGTLEEFGLEHFTEGMIRQYFVDMDRLTACNPKNYDFASDEDTEVKHCAQDIWNLLNNSETKVEVVHEGGLTDDEIEDMTDVKNADEEHSTAGEDGDYYLLKYYIKAQPGMEGECASGNWWTKYTQVLEAAREAMRSVANGGYNDVTVVIPDYMEDPLNGTTVTTKTFTTIEAIEEELASALAILKNAPKTRHTIRFDHRVDPTGASRTEYDTGVFVCTKVPPEEDSQNKHKALYLEDYNSDGTIIPGKEVDNTADLGVYDALSFAYTTIDFNRYENDYIMTSAKAEFDKLLDDGTGVGESIEESTDTGHEMDPQKFVDQKVTEMLTAINTANSDIYTVYFQPMFYVVDAEGNEEAIDMYDPSDWDNSYWRQIDIHGDGSAYAYGIGYGETLNLSVPAEYEGNVYKWVIESYDDEGNKKVSTRMVDPAVAEDASLLRNYSMRMTSDVSKDIYITAYMAPSDPASEDQILVKLLNPYDKAVTQFIANKTDSVSLDSEDNLVIGENTYELTSEYNITNYNITGFDVKKDTQGNVLEGKTVADYLTTDKSYAFIRVAFEKASTTYNYTLNGETLQSEVEPDTLVTVESDVERPTGEAYDPFVAIAIDQGENYAVNGSKFRYLPISYTRQFSFYAVCDLDFVDITCNEAATEFYANGVKIGLDTSGDASYYRFAIERRTTKMPFIWAKMESPSTGQFMVYNYYTNIEDLEAGNDQAAQFVEAGTCFAKQNLDLDLFKEDNSAVYTVKASKRVFDSYFSVKIKSSSTLWARSYVKYKYSFVPAREEGDETVTPTTIEAIIYGDVVTVS